MSNEVKTIIILIGIIFILSGILIYTNTRSVGYKERYNLISEHYQDARETIKSISSTIGRATEIVTTVEELQSKLQDSLSTNEELIRERETTNIRLEKLTEIAGDINNAVEGELDKSLNGIAELKRQLAEIRGEAEVP